MLRCIAITRLSGYCPLPAELSHAVSRVGVRYRERLTRRTEANLWLASCGNRCVARVAPELKTLLASEILCRVSIELDVLRAAAVAAQILFVGLQNCTRNCTPAVFGIFQGS